jgi:rod shape-determining protein MreD
MADSGVVRIAWVPTTSVALASVVTALPLMLDTALLPPFGLLMLLSWRLMRSDLWPVWIAIPLGLWDDLFSGQPPGSAMALWSLALLAMEALDARVVWRDYRIDWLIGAVIIAAVLLAGAGLAQAGSGAAVLPLVMPQIVISWFTLPAAMLLVGRLDRWRLRR